LGFSGAKVIAIQGIAQAQLDQKLPDRIRTDSMSNEEIIEALIPLRGVGKWTVEMLLIFTLGRLDVMPVDDFGVKTGLMQLLSLKTMPKKTDFASLTDGWSPYRSIGAWYLWRIADATKLSHRR
jgi:DNA-3-methyladenine glycosylase II